MRVWEKNIGKEGHEDKNKGDVVSWSQREEDQLII